MTLKDIALQLKKHSKILIFCHNRPDGDTLGSGFALKYALERLGKTVDLVCPSVIPNKYDSLGILSKSSLPQDVISTYDCHVAVDCSTEMMVGDAYGLFQSNKTNINVDHHVSNSRYAEFNYVENRASCCEIIYGLILELGVDIDKQIAECALLGIITDTGNFMHSNVDENTLLVASKLVAVGADSHKIAYAMFKSQKLERAKLYAHVINNMRLYEDGKIAIISVFKSDFEKFYATQDMTEGFIDFPLSVDGVEVAVSIMESKENCYKVSFRSKGKINVNEIASDFGGGGHVLASGCVVCGFYEDVKDKIIRAISNNF